MEAGQKKAAGTPSVQQGMARKSIKTVPEKLRGAQQAVPMTPGNVMLSPTEGPNSSSSEGEAEVDPMVSMPIKPFVIPIVLEAQRRRN